MKIAFVSTRGIPNNYGGFEQFAGYISVGLTTADYDKLIDAFVSLKEKKDI